MGPLRRPGTTETGDAGSVEDVTHGEVEEFNYSLTTENPTNGAQKLQTTTNTTETDISYVYLLGS